MKILIVANDSVGLYKFRKELIIRLLENNEVLLTMPKGLYDAELKDIGCKIDNFSIDRRGKNPFKDIILFFYYLRLLMFYKPERVITYTIKPNIYMGFCCRILKIPYFTNITGLGSIFEQKTFLGKIVIKMYRIALEKSKTVFFENVENEKIFLKNNIVSKKQSCRLNGAGVNLKEFGFQEYPNILEITFLFSGRIMREKGINELLQAIINIKKEYKNINLVIIGNYEENFKNYMIKLIDKKIIRYYGFQKDVCPFIKDCSCFVLPSYHEGMSNSILEAAAMGRPIITTNIPGCREAVIDGFTGLLCDKENAQDLEEKMRMFINLPLEQKKEMAKRSYAFIAENFDRKNVIEKTIGKLNL